MKPFLSVIIPAYNEAKRLPLTLVDVDRHLSTAEFSSEILVIDDGSTDATKEIVERFSHLLQNLRLIKVDENSGKGAAVRLGMLSARGNLRLFMDADNSTSVDQFNKMLPYFKEGYDLVIGSRTVEGTRLTPPQSFLRQAFGKLGNLFIQVLAAKGIGDTQCGFKCFSEVSAEKIFSSTIVDRFAFDVEILALARLMGYRIKEIPVVWSNDPRSTVGFTAYVSTLRDVVRIWWRIKHNRYALL
ncbi:glycosyltransferase family 2 protein [Candidatus Jorgensenbacteria bacterium]|nr:glycosyltransferase family 2 protein [Candidatus Jorgensenbacteria bacterium]